jgi:hypothetical protein
MPFTDIVMLDAFAAGRDTAWGFGVTSGAIAQASLDASLIGGERFPPNHP